MNQLETKELIQNTELAKKYIQRIEKAESQILILKYQKCRNKIRRNYAILAFLLGFPSLGISGFLLQYFKLNHDYIAVTAMIIALIVIFAIYNLGKTRERLFIKKRLAKIRPELDNLNRIITEEKVECEKNCLLPSKYWNSNAVNKIIEYIENLRAESLKEAINLFELERNNNRQTSMLNQLTSQQLEMIKTQQKISKQIAWQNIIISTKQ